MIRGRFSIPNPKRPILNFTVGALLCAALCWGSLLWGIDRSVFAQEARPEEQHREGSGHWQGDFLKPADQQFKEVLALLEGLPPRPSVSFTGLVHEDLLTKIYEGDFESFTGGLTPEQRLQEERALRKVFRSLADASELDQKQAQLKQHQLRLEEYARRRTPLQLAQKAYHEAYTVVCRQSSSTIAWRELTLPRVRIQRDSFGQVRNRIHQKAVTVEVRGPFAGSYRETFSFRLDPDPFAPTAVPGGLSNFTREAQTDFEVFLRRAGCDASEVRYFEVNLFLAHRWLPPAQELVGE